MPVLSLLHVLVLAQAGPCGCQPPHGGLALSGWGWGLEDSPEGNRGGWQHSPGPRCPSSSAPTESLDPSMHLQLSPCTQQHNDSHRHGNARATSPRCMSHGRHGPVRMPVGKQVSPGQSALPPPFPSLAPLPNLGANYCHYGGKGQHSFLG